MKNNLKKIYITTITLLLIFSIFVIYGNSKQIISLSVDTTENEFFSQNSLTYGKMEEEILNEENAQYDTLDDGNIVINKYYGDKSSIIIPNMIDNHKIEKISTEAFLDAQDNLEAIKIPIEIAENIDYIQGFKKSEDFSYEGYVVYITVREYNEAYLIYNNLTDKEKENWGVIPEKFKRTWQEVKTEEKAQILEATDSIAPSNYDLRKNRKINIPAKNQASFGICYAYAALTSVETNLALTQNVIRDFSEIHLAIKSKQACGGMFSTTYENYFRKGYGPVTEIFGTLLNQSYITSNYKNNDVAKNIYLACTQENSGVTDSQMNEAIQTLDNLCSEQEYYVMKCVNSSYVDGKDKKNSLKEPLVEMNRNLIKEYVMKYGSVWTYIAGPVEGKNYVDYGSTAVQYQSDNKYYNGAHAVSIIGWDDNFDQFPESWKVPNKGAWLALNSWGDAWGNGDGTWWIAYDDYWVETCNSAVSDVSKGKININDKDKVNISLATTSYIYNGEERKPKVTVKYNGNTLCYENTDYEVEYRNNKNVGTAKAIITGIGRYTGTVEIEFKISRADGEIRNGIVYNSETGNYEYYKNDEIDTTFTSIVCINNVWYLFVNGITDYTYNGIVTNGNEAWYVDNGKVTFKHNELVSYQNKWVAFVNSKMEPKYTGLSTNKNGTYYLKNGVVQNNYSGPYIVSNEEIYIISKGKVVPKYTGLACINTIWYYFRNGNIDYTYNGIAVNEKGTWYVDNGKVTFKHNELISYQNKWVAFVNSKMNVTYTGLSTNKNGTYYLKNGTVQNNYNGTYIATNGKIYIISKGKTLPSYTGLACVDTIWYYFKNGNIDYTYNGIAINEKGTWYVDSGKVTFKHNELVSYQNKWVAFVNSKMNVTYTGLSTNKNGTYYLKNGTVQKNYNGTYKAANGNVYIIRNGKVV